MTTHDPRPTQEHRAIADRLAAELELPRGGVAAAVALFDEGATVPFVARYRKEATGGLDEVALRAVEEGRRRLMELDRRRASILASLAEQGVDDPSLLDAVRQASDRTTLEDLYAPHRPRRRTRATAAREAGLEPLAEVILAQPTSGPPPRARAAAFTSDAVPDVDAALAGARDIVAEQVAEEPRVRQRARQGARRMASLRVRRRGGRTAGDDPRGTFAAYYELDMPIGRLRPHQVLAVDRGEAEAVLRVRLELPERAWRPPVDATFAADPRSPWASELEAAIQDAAKRLLVPAMQRDLRRELTASAHEHAIEVFATNLRGLLLQPPLTGRTVLGIDPAYRTGCKLAAVDPTGQLLACDTIYPHPPRKQLEQASTQLRQLAAEHGASLIAIGNGTASRETESFVASLLPDLDGVRYLVVNEAGASVYSASELAGAELPELDVSLRGAVSIARRVQDPLAELVKIEPRAIGVGLYQHDLDQHELDRALDGVVEDVVSAVGVDANTASPALLARVPAIGPALAEAIVAHRDTHGPFKTRRDLLDVAGVGAKTFEQAAGFLRVHGDAALDASAIHPESYEAARELLRRAGLDPRDPPAPAERADPLNALLTRTPVAELSRELAVGEPTLRDIVEQLVRPGRDPRADAPPPLLRAEAMKLADLQVGTVLSGTVRNVVDFGAFVDIGVGQDGLVHRSRVGRGRRLADLSVGTVIEVEVERVDVERQRIGLRWVD